jgi:adenosylcobyric acid synthase
MLQGTGSDVGKSVIVAGLARAYAKRGLLVLPFKPQNMSNNAAVTADGGEIGRAQALQARAAGVAPRSDMNPVLLKPQGNRVAQVIVEGRVHGVASASDYQMMKPRLLPRVLGSFARLEAEADLVLVEGAGSAAEVNLRSHDIANMGFALAAEVPVVLVGDIDRGGVIAQLVGTHELLVPAERALVKGYIVNKFRGDLGLFADALDIIRARTGMRCFGIVPWLDAIRDLPAEDSMGLRQIAPTSRPDKTKSTGIRIVVPLLPRIANFDDLDPLRAEPAVSIELVESGRPLPLCDLILLPGSKATLADLAVLRREGWDIDIAAHVRHGGHVLGICAGYQMLGRAIADPRGLEGEPEETQGLGLLDVATELAPEKILHTVDGIEVESGAAVKGYEMHLGRTDGPDTARPMLNLAGHPDGARSIDGRVAGCHLHGLFASDAFRRAFIARLGAAPDLQLDNEARIETALDTLARHLELHLDLDALLAHARAR